MKCPKCGYTSFDYLDSCKKCENSLTEFKSKFGLRSLIFPNRPVQVDDFSSNDSLEQSDASVDAGADFGYDLSEEPLSQVSTAPSGIENSASSAESSPVVAAQSDSDMAEDEDEFDFGLDWSETASASSELRSTAGELPVETEGFEGVDSAEGLAAGDDSFSFDFDEQDPVPEPPPEEPLPSQGSAAGAEVSEAFDSAPETPLEGSSAEQEVHFDFEELASESPEAAQDAFGSDSSSDPLLSAVTTAPVDTGFDAGEMSFDDLTLDELQAQEEEVQEEEVVGLSFEDLSDEDFEVPEQEAAAELPDPFATAFDELDDFDDLDFSDEDLDLGKKSKEESEEEKEDPPVPFDRKEATSVEWSSIQVDAADDSQQSGAAADDLLVEVPAHVSFEEAVVLAAAPVDEQAESSVDEQEDPPSAVIRLAAMGADLGLLAGVLLLFFWVGQKLLASPGQSNLLPPLEEVLYLATPYFLVLFITHFVYFALFHLLAGQTPGKMLFRIRVVDEGGGDISPGQAFLRTVGGLFSALSLGLGFLPAFRPEGRSWNDRIAGTRIVWSLDEGESELDV